MLHQYRNGFSFAAFSAMLPRNEGGTMNTSFETMVRTYKDTDDYQKDQKKLAKDGWSTQAMVERKPRAGVGRIVTLGMASVIRPPKPELVVTYQRAIVA